MLSWPDVLSGPPETDGSAGAAGTAYVSLAQAPKSLFLQRALQNGRYGLSDAKMLGPEQPGHRMVRVWFVGLSFVDLFMSTRSIQNPHRSGWA
jgi:hypothetical protein